MSTINNGGPAFPFDPSVPLNRLDLPHTGMTLLDWFAGKELQKTHGTDICDIPEAYDRLAEHCYRMADAMIRAREAK